MALSSELAKEELSVRRCKTCVWYEQLGKTDKAAFDQWLTDGKSIAALYRACQRERLTAARTRFQEHVREHAGASTEAP